MRSFASCANSAGRILIATDRSSRVSRARYTSPIPPAPSGATTSYGPSCVPVDRIMIEPDYAIRSDAADEICPPLLSGNQIVVVERYFSAAGAQRAIAEFRVELWQK